MSVQEGSILTREMQRSTKLGAYGTYEYNRLPPKSQPGATTNGGDVSEFEIPAKCINHYYDRLEFTLTLPDDDQIPVGSPAVDTDAFNKMFIDGIVPIREIQFMTQGGKYMAYIPQLNKYTNAIFRRTIPFEKLATFERVSQTTDAGEVFEGLSMCNSSTNVRIPVTPGALVAPKELYIEPSSIVRSATVNTPLSLNFKINLNLIYDSIWNVSHDINFNEITLVRIIWDGPQFSGFRGTSSTNTGTNITACSAIKLTNLYMFYAVQQNQSIIDMVKEEKQQQIMIPYLYYNKIQGSASNSAGNTLSVKFSPVHGSRLVRMYWCPYNNAESGSTIYDSDNTGGLKVASFHVEIDGVRTCPYEYITTNYDDYEAVKHLIKGSSILSRNDHLKYFTHIENFGSNYGLVQEFDYDRQLWKEGMPLDKEVKIDIFSTNPTANTVQTQNYIYTVCQRRLVVDKEAGIFIDSGSM